MAALSCLAGCGGGHGGPPGSEGSGRAANAGPIAAPVPLRPFRPALGLTEDNADLLWSPSSPVRTGGEAFQASRVRLTALHPRYLRLLVNWGALQPRPGTAPALAAAADGCARGTPPCGRFRGVQAQLAAIASQQRSEPGSFQVVVQVLGAPAWAALAPSGCEPAGTLASARPLRPQALASYRALISSLLTLASTQGVELPWWSPWNEPNDPRFVSPQHATCSADDTPLAPLAYASLARAMASELRSAGGEHHMLLGELNDLQVDSPNTTSVASFIAALPADVLCLAGAWSIHDYASRHGPGAPPDGVAAIERALDARGGCARTAPVWVTEAGAGAPHPGQARPTGGADELAGCQALARQLLRWYRDPRVAAVFQYSFREDPAFPVGLVSAELSHVYPAYRLWLSFARRRTAGLAPPSPAGGCA